jgi:hypothetical protein
MKPLIESFFVNRQDPEQVARLRTFAASFDHTIESLAHPIIVFHRGDKWIAYAQIVQTPTVFPAFHTNPDVCSKRDTYFVSNQLVGWTKIQFGGALLARPIRQGSKFTQDITEHLGGKCMNKELFEF